MYIMIEGENLENFNNREIVLFGASSTGKKALEEFERIHANIVGFCDNDKKKWGLLFEGYPIISPNKLKEITEKNSGLAVMITSTYEKEIKEQLLKIDIENFYTVHMGVLYDKIDKEEFKNTILKKQEANKVLTDKLLSDDPFFIGRIGSTELETICNYCYFTDRIHQSGIPYTKNITTMLSDWCGFFPSDHKKMDEFCELYITEIKKADLLWSMWSSRYEDRFYQDYCPNTNLTLYDDTGFPIDIENPWTTALKGKKILVIHPFESSIRNNYEKRKVLFTNSDFLPEFELITLKAVQTLADNKNTEFSTWFEALDYMKNQMNKIDFDIALIGAGAYGFPLGSYAKELGKKAMHIGGALQLYFGIRGVYYDQFHYHNEYWTRPLEEEKPQGFKKVDAGRYW